MTTTNSAQATQTASGEVGIIASTAERVVTGARAPAAVRAERRAWLMLGLAFATFCTLVFAAFKFTIDYVSSADVDQPAIITASRGQIAFSLPGSAEKTLLGSRSDLGVGTVLWLDRTTAASVELQLFEDSSVKLLAGSTLELTRMEVGRFRNQHTVLLTQRGGPIRYATGDAMDVQVPGGAVHLAEHGDYTIWIVDDRSRILVYDGEARISGIGGVPVTVSAGHRAEIDAKSQTFPVSELALPLLTNSDFGQRDIGWLALDVPNSALDVNGSRSWVDGPEAGTLALRVMRQSVKGEHGETGLVQQLNNIDVSGFRHLWLQAWVRVDYADLSGGGTLNSEYPMMFRVKYEGPVEGSYVPWANGLYYSNPDNRPIPQGVAEQWPQGEWRLYQVDLMDTDPSNVPYRLQEFAVMGQGHSYDARVASISLIGE